MAEYIKRNDAHNAISWIDETSILTAEALHAEIRKIPAADVRDNVRGKWIELPNGWDGIDEYLRFECSNCHAEVFLSFPFCPYCAADMREER